MTPPLSIGDEVIIIGPSEVGSTTQIGHKMTISQIDEDDGLYSSKYFFWYPASSLRLVEEELKIGDYVESISNEYLKGKVFRVEAFDGSPGEVRAGNIYFSTKSLRKLTPEEVKQHLKPKVELSQDALEKLLERLIAIEKRLDIQGDRLNTIDLEKDDLRKCLAFVEKFQRDQSDLIGRAIRDGVAEILDFRRKA